MIGRQGINTQTHLGIFPVHKDGVSVPAQVEVHAGVAGGDVGLVAGVPGLAPVHVQGDPHLPALGRRKVRLVGAVGPGVGPDLVVGGCVGGGAGADDARGHGAGPVTLEDMSQT